MRNYNSSIIQRNITLRRMDINPITLVVIILSLMLSVLFSTSILYNSIIFSFICIFVTINNQFISLFLIPLKRFRIFILFSLLFMILSDYALSDITIYTIKIIILLLLSSLFNQFLDFNYLLIFLDRYLSKIKPIFLRILSRKILYAFILGIKSVSELFRIGTDIIQLKKIRGFKKNESLRSKISENINLLRSLFIKSFIVAKNTDIYFSSKGFSFSSQRSFYLIRTFQMKDYFLIALSIVIIVL
ncbi:MAG: hypothetical protein KAH33_05380 [Candidatus Delongbacteria bacterium]|nr:hypothetical protein [Candidatus Delongbacteria bacterium]